MLQLAQRELNTMYGVFNEILFYDGHSESIALVMGDVANAENVLCRVHSACIGGHVFNSVECECADEMRASQEMIGQAGTGVIIYLDQEGRGNGHLALLKSIPFKKSGLDQGAAYERAGYPSDGRSYRPAAEILKHLTVTSIVLLTNNSAKADDLRDAAIAVSNTKPLARPI